MDPKATTNHVIEPELGQTAESPDATTWTIKLRPDAKFHNIAPVNGHPVEAEDVKATFQRALDPSTSNPNRGALSMIDVNQIQTPDKQTVVFTLKYPYSPFRSLLASPAYSSIYPREAFAGSYDPAKVVIGSGPFTLDSAQPDVAFVYKKNPGYFEKDRPYVDAVRMAVIVDPSQQFAQFTGGNVDEYLAPIDNLEVAKQRNPKAAVIKAEQGGSSPPLLSARRSELALYGRAGSPSCLDERRPGHTGEGDLSRPVPRDGLSSGLHGPVGPQGGGPAGRDAAVLQIQPRRCEEAAGSGRPREPASAILPDYRNDRL